MTKKSSKSKLITCFLLLICLIYGIALTYLYYNQALYTKGGLFESDLAAHIRMGVQDHFYYSFTAFVYIFLSQFPYSTLLIALFLSAMSLLSIGATYLLLKEIRIALSENSLFVASILLNFVMAFYVQSANARHYIGYQSANMWHNSTYTCMKPVALLTIWFFLKVAKQYKEKLSLRNWLILAVLFALGAGIKPSFFLVFAPFFALLLLKDLIIKTPFRKCFFFGSTVFPACLIILWQSLVLFGDSTGNGYEIAPFYTLSQRGDHPKAALILSVLFPLVVFLFHINDFYKDRLYRNGLFLWFIGFLEVFLLKETGERSLDSNFMWGYSISLFILFMVSLIRLIQDFNDKNFPAKYNAIRYPYLIGCGLLFLYHVFSGLWYFVLLLSGATFFV